ncbi:molybdate ABC transporter substrate-binding protein [Colwellia sp. Arc7-635]|uniref:molybdate ABC transporter substrate-binding protein n=1 Tax=Colwellia sp. Arc7-635 TaxID=2497879 RepID=UPI000F8512E2|nr:molybdate ABC transporter substrate-binding protein [Colwellia sp. Arc7-635]AZQ83289.1 molybdate ABC transporter substrate-binding protein [Colwellia sp. Arc7-635]
MPTLISPLIARKILSLVTKLLAKLRADVLSALLHNFWHLVIQKLTVKSPKEVISLCLTWLALQVNPVYADDNPTQQHPLRIAVAANFAPALKVLLADLPNKNNIDIQVISAATGTLYQQIKHGAPFDLFLSADTSRPALLEQDKLIIAGSRKTYAYGQIALWSATQPLSSLDELNHYSGNLAIANPDTAPYGKAAQQALKHLSLWSHVEGKLITGININQTFQQVRSQAVPLGIVAYSQLTINNYHGVIIPSEYYQPIAQQLVIVKSTPQAKLAQTISDFILQASSQSKLQKLGYLSIIPEPISESNMDNTSKVERQND